MTKHPAARARTFTGVASAAALIAMAAGFELSAQATELSGATAGTDVKTRTLSPAIPNSGATPLAKAPATATPAPAAAATDSGSSSSGSAAPAAAAPAAAAPAPAPAPVVAAPAPAPAPVVVAPAPAPVTPPVATTTPSTKK
jgi:2-oxoglutarate dehydrogenase E2 component (dihydrolipoamide succinyltransferase)